MGETNDANPSDGPMKGAGNTKIQERAKTQIQDEAKPMPPFECLHKQDDTEAKPVVSVSICAGVLRPTWACQHPLSEYMEGHPLEELAARREAMSIDTSYIPLRKDSS